MTSTRTACCRERRILLRIFDEPRNRYAPTPAPTATPTRAHTNTFRLTRRELTRPPPGCGPCGWPGRHREREDVRAHEAGTCKKSIPIANEGPRAPSPPPREITPVLGFPGIAAADLSPRRRKIRRAPSLWGRVSRR